MPKLRDPFSPVVCDTIRNLLAARKKAEMKRDDLFKARDYAKDELDKTGKDEDAKRTQMEADYGRCVIAIAQYDRAIKRIQTQLDDAVENADNEKLFDEDPTVNFAELLSEPRSAAKPNKPVGGPSAKEPPKKPAIAAPEPALQISGVDEHLAASVNELDLGEYEKGKLVKAEFNTIGDVAKLMDSPSEPDLQEAWNLSPRQVANVCRAVKKYRGEHREAMRKAEGVA